MVEVEGLVLPQQRLAHTVTLPRGARVLSQAIARRIWLLRVLLNEKCGVRDRMRAGCASVGKAICWDPVYTYHHGILLEAVLCCALFIKQLVVDLCQVHWPQFILCDYLFWVTHLAATDLKGCMGDIRLETKLLVLFLRSDFQGCKMHGFSSTFSQEFGFANLHAFNKTWKCHSRAVYSLLDIKPFFKNLGTKLQPKMQERALGGRQTLWFFVYCLLI